MRTVIAGSLMLLTALGLGGTSASAQDTPVSTDEDKIYVIVQVENDVITGTDRHYTNGLRVAALAPETTTPAWARRVAEAVPYFPTQAMRRWGVSVGHSIFTPDDLEATAPLPDQRPYAGWLYGSLNFVSDTGQRMDFLELQAGIVGPSARGEAVQNDWHALIGSDEARGWRNQLRDEPGIMVSYVRKQRAWQSIGLPLGFQVDVTPHAGVALGNVLTAASAGGTIRLGRRLPQDYGPPLIRPNLTGSSYFVPGGLTGWYLFAGVEGRAVARNIFLDGNTFRDSARVDRLPFVGDLQAGLVITLGDVRLAYTHIVRSREYRQQSTPDSYGSVSATVRF